MRQESRQDGEQPLTYEMSADESFSEGVIAAVSRVSELDAIPESPSESDRSQALEPLYTALDPDALDALFRNCGSDGETARSDGRIEFSYHGYEVTARSDGEISVEAADD